MKQRQMTNSQDSTDGRNVRHFVSDKKPQLLADRRKAFEERDRDSATVYVKKFIQSLIPPGKEGRVSVSPIEIQRSLAEKGQTFSKHIINKAIYGLIKQGKLRKMTRTERTTINRNVWRTASEEMRKRHHDGVVTAWGRRTPEEKSEIRSKSASKQWENKTGFTNLSYLEKMPILNRFSGRQALKMFEDCFMRFSGIKVTSEKTSLTINPLRSFSNNPLKEDIQSEYWKAVWYAIVIWNGERNLDELIADSIIFHMIRFFRQEKKERTSIVGMEPNIAERVNARRSTSQEG